MKRVLLTGIAVLFLATGTAHAGSIMSDNGYKGCMIAFVEVIREAEINQINEQFCFRAMQQVRAAVRDHIHSVPSSSELQAAICHSSLMKAWKDGHDKNAYAPPANVARQIHKGCWMMFLDMSEGEY